MSTSYGKKHVQLNHAFTEVFLGGFFTNVTVPGEGLIVIQDEESTGLTYGDRIICINGITNPSDMVNFTDNFVSSSLDLIVEREKRTISITKPEGVHILAREKSIALSYCTFMEKDRFALTGHSFSTPYGTPKEDVFGNKIQGYLYRQTTFHIDHQGRNNANINGINHQIGKVLKETAYGVFGSVHNPVRELDTIETAETIYPKKDIVLYLDIGDGPQEYYANILPDGEKDPNFLNSTPIEITDSFLLQKIGGGFKGMSGAPVIQGDYLIGAIRSVYITTNRALAYFVTIDKMLEGIHF